MSASVSPPKKILIVGAGEFGSATALSLVKGPYRGHEHLITIIDRAAEPPAIDAASSDLNKILRQDYGDPIYAKLAVEALRRWRLPEWSNNFHESGVVVGAARGSTAEQYVKNSLNVNLQEWTRTKGKEAYEVKGPTHLASFFPSEVKLGDFSETYMYYNEAGGWGYSRGAVVDTINRLRKAGVKFVAGEASSLIHTESQKDVRGVRTRDGSELYADLVILCMGSWTPNLLPELQHELTSTGQMLGTIQLSKAVADHYRDTPVMLFLDSGFYCFPPNEDNVFKFAIHGPGFLNPTAELCSTPRTTLTPGYEHQQVPLSGRAQLLRELEKVFPELAQLEWSGSRLCWYSDRPSGDWLLDYHESYPSLFVAAGGSGHAFKFMPVMGDLIVSSLTRSWPKEHSDIWSYHHRIPGRKDGSRGPGGPEILLGSYTKQASKL